MQEIGEITEITIDCIQEKDETTKKDDIEVGLEIVALEMGNILEELKENLEQLLWKRDIEKISQINTNSNEKSARKTKRSSSNEQSLLLKTKTSSNSNERSSSLKTKGSSNNNIYQVKKLNANAQNTHKNNVKTNGKKKNSSLSSMISVNNNNSKEVQKKPLNSSSRSNSGVSQISAIGSSRSTPRSELLQKVAQIKKRYSSLCYNKPYEQNPKFKLLKEQVENAIREKKVFTVCGNYYSIRRALLTRGWVEKVRISYNTNDRENLKRLESSSYQELLEGITNPQNGYIYKRMIQSKLVGQHQVDFYWDQNFDCFRICHDNVKLTMVNRFRRGIFSYTSKQGLCESMKRAYWFQKPGVVEIHHPRSYNLSNADDPKDFISDFKLTAAMSLLKWVVYNVESNHANKIISKLGKVPVRIFNFAVNEVSKAVRKCRHEDIDYEIEEALDYQWNEFLEYYYKIVHIGNHFKFDEKYTAQGLLEKSKTSLEKVSEYWPHLKMDGVMNIWILKPVNGSRGEGIYLCRTLQYILKILKSNTTRRYIVQKYIERPLIIHNTKFDIRQWFLISSALPLTIWIYKDCYVRFSSQIYNLHKLHESIHLTNNSIQCRYHNCRRNSALPACNMWDSNQFQKYLASIGHPQAFAEKIYPGMKKCLTGAILMNQYNLDSRKNCFELYGSDFMVTEDFQPWLIEINSRPALYPSTPVTARMCPQVLEDLIKVVIDNARNPNAATGRFELLYKQKLVKLPPVKSEALKLWGTQLPTSYFYTPEFNADGQLKCYVSSKSEVDCTHYNVKELSKEMKKTLENLLSVIHAERERRKRLQNKFSQASGFTEIFTNMELNENNDDYENEAVKNDEIVTLENDTADEENENTLKFPKIQETTSKFSNNVVIDLEVTKSAAKEIKRTRSNQIVKKQFLVPLRPLPIDDEIDEALKSPAVIKSKVSKNIFKNIIESARSNSFNCNQ